MVLSAEAKAAITSANQGKSSVNVKLQAWKQTMYPNAFNLYPYILSEVLSVEMQTSTGQAIPVNGL